MSEAIDRIERDDPRYPELLRAIHHPPEALYVRGTLPSTGLPFAVVGTRVPSPYGKQITPKLVEPLAAAGMVIVSGLAYGIDALAHEAALAVGGATVAVLGTGVDEASLYPRQHRKLARRIVEAGGALISEYPPGTPGQPAHFPARNRIIAGISRGVLIIEARDRSGALITADLALRENRDVFAVPGPITVATSLGPNRLIRDGATPVLGSEDILTAYGLAEREKPLREEGAFSDDEQRILDRLATGAVHVDALSRELALSPATLSATLAMLELQGLVRHLGGGVWGRS